MLVVSVALILVGTFLPTPLAAPIQENAITPLADVRAPWFFLWVQFLLRFGDAFWFGVAIPLGILAVFAVLPYIFPGLPASQQGRWFAPAGRAVQIIAASLALAVLILTALEIFLY